MSEGVYRHTCIRGVAERDLPDGLVYRVGVSTARLLRPNAAPVARIVVARDCRRSSPRLFEALVHGMVDGGADVIDVGVGPMPLLSFGVQLLEGDGGVMITGGHEPGDVNGFKLVRASGPLGAADIRTLAERARDTTPPVGTRGSLQTTPIEDAYLDELRDRVLLAEPKPKLVVDGGHGVAGPVGMRALRRAGLAPIGLNATMDGSFPRHPPDPSVPANLAELGASVRQHGAGLGVSWDADGDRLGVVDASGEVVAPARLLVLFARDVLAARAGAAIVVGPGLDQTVMDDIAAHSGRALRADLTSATARASEEGALLAGDVDGHFAFGDRYHGYDDAIYATLRLVDVLARSGRALHELPIGWPDVAECAAGVES
ncbi:MAG: phosphomannomutase [Polyangiaceae bacterium]|nr:phosphomannomutase [Polyangiaceae bacterium]